MSKSRIYLDFNATTPLAPELTCEFEKWLKYWGNPSSIYEEGQKARNLLRQAQQNLSDFIGAEPQELRFTSSATEANNWALKGVMHLNPGKTLVISSVEHSSVLKTAQFLQTQGFKVMKIPVNKQGLLDMDFYDQVLNNEDVALVSIMSANNETGVLYPCKKLAQKAHSVGALFHCDGVQSLGKTVVDVKHWEVDLASFSAHKVYSLKGCGVLYIKQGVLLESLIHGGGQERGMRGGTEDLLSCLAFGTIAQVLKNQVESQSIQIKIKRDYLENCLLQEVSGVRILAQDTKRLCNTVNILIEGIDLEALLINLDQEGFSVSSGAACHSGKRSASHVLLAMGLSETQARSSLRISLGWKTSKKDIDLFIKTLKKQIAHLKSLELKKESS